MPEKRTPVFVECMKCGERWKIATLPVGASILSKALKAVVCPNCFAEADQIGLCHTEEPNAVVAPRDGCEMPQRKPAPPPAPPPVEVPPAGKY